MNLKDINKIKEFLGHDFCRAIADDHKFHKEINLYLRTAYVIKKFIETSDKNILFINFPIEEINLRSDEIQYETWFTLCDLKAMALRSCLYMSETVPSIDDLIENGKYYLVIMPQDSQEEFYFVKVTSNAKKQKILKFYWATKFINGHYRNKPNLGTRKVKEEILNQAEQIFEITQLPTLDRNGCITEKRYKPYRKEFELLNSIRSNYSLKSPYKSGFIVYSPANDELPAAGKLISPIVQTYNRNGSLPKSDLAIIAGDNAYNIVHTLKNRVLQGNLKKLIIFGSVFPEELKNSNNTETVIFSHKELFDYCVPNNNLSYCPPEFHEIEFPWLKKSLSNLKIIIEEILQKYQESEDPILENTLKYIFNFSKKHLVSIDFNNEKLEIFKARFPSFLEGDEFVNLNDVEIEKLLDWCNTLAYDCPTNPKADYCKENNAYKIIKTDKVKRASSSNMGYNNLVVINAPQSFPNQENLINQVARFFPFQKIHCLYYKDIESDKLQRTRNVFLSDPIFCEFNQDITNESQESHNFNLEDYNVEQNYDGLRFFIDRFSSATTVEFTDNTSEGITGDIVIFEDEMSRRVSITELDLDSLSGSEIIFYSQSEDANNLFDEITKKYFVLNDGKTINDYANLWQKALNELLNQNSQELFNQICEEVHIRPQTLRNHLNGNVKFLRGKSMERILDILVDSGKLSDTDKENVLRARRLHNIEYKKFGIKLKDALLDSFMNANNNVALLKEIEEKTGYIPEKLLKVFIKTRIVK